MSESRTGSGSGGGIRPALVALTTALGTIETTMGATESPDAERVDLLRQLEVLRCATEAAQAALGVDLATSQTAAQAAAGVPAARQGRGVAAQLGLARRESVHRATHRLGVAQLVMADLPCVAAAWRAGHLTEHRVTRIAAAARPLDRPDRLALDTRLAGTTALVTRLAGDGERTAEARAHDIAESLDRGAYLTRRAAAVAERHTTLRRATGDLDGMAWLSALLPITDAITAQTSLADAVATARATREPGDDRSRGQVMADTLVDRITGRSPETPVPVHVEIVVPVDVATGTGEHADTTCWAPAYGPVPADVARAWAESAAEAGVATYTRIWADAATGQVIGTESRSAARDYPAGFARHARRRDRVCRVPWCDAPVRHTDHTVAHADGGETSIQNAGGVCEAHNYAKQAPGWTATTGRDPDGTHTITYTTPTGHTHTSRPPPSYPPRD